MARFILDVNTDNTLAESQKLMKDLMGLFDTLASITCVNVTNGSQFYEGVMDNSLTDTEIKTFNDNPHG